MIFQPNSTIITFPSDCTIIAVIWLILQSNPIVILATHWYSTQIPLLISSYSSDISSKIAYLQLYLQLLHYNFTIIPLFHCIPLMLKLFCVLFVVCSYFIFHWYKTDILMFHQYSVSVCGNSVACWYSTDIPLLTSGTSVYFLNVSVMSFCRLLEREWSGGGWWLYDTQAGVNLPP